MTSNRLLIVHTPHTLDLLTPEGTQQLELSWLSVLSDTLTADQQTRLTECLTALRHLPVDIALSASLLPVHYQPLQHPLRQAQLHRFLQRRYPRGTQIAQSHRYTPTGGNHLLSCGLTRYALQHLTQFWQRWQLKLRHIAPLVELVPGALDTLAGTHVLLFHARFERSLSLRSARELRFVINQQASFEDLFHCLNEHAPSCPWERRIDLLASPPPHLAIHHNLTWLDAWYWFTE